MTTSFYDGIAKEYDSTRGGDERARMVANLLAPHLPPGVTCLDIGVGTGSIPKHLESLGRRPVGIDRSSGMLALARQRNIPVCQADGAALPFHSSTFGGVYAVWVLHVVSNGKALIDEC